MAMVLLIGGARSGKSDLAVQIAARQPAPVTLIATAEAGDPEMEERIARHRLERPSGWNVIEEPIGLERAVTTSPAESCVIVDCLTLWVANLLPDHDDETIEGLAAAAAAAGAARAGLTLVVSNEVGLAIVPDNAIARRYRDLLGRVNAEFATASERAYLLVAGRLLALEPPDGLLEELGS